MSRDEGAGEPGFEQFERFLEEWSRRDFLRRMGLSAAWLAFSAGAVDLLEACGAGGTNTTSVNPVKGGKLIEGTIHHLSTFNTLTSGDVNSTLIIVFKH